MLLESLGDIGQEELCDTIDLYIRERIIDNNIIDTVEELDTEVFPELFADFFISFRFIDGLTDILTSDIRGHDDDRILHVHRSSFSIGEFSFIENLEKNIPHIGMCLLDFIEEDHRVRMSSHGLRELSTFLISDISRRSSDQTSHGM